MVFDWSVGLFWACLCVRFGFLYLSSVQFEDDIHALEMSSALRRVSQNCLGLFDDGCFEDGLSCPLKEDCPALLLSTPLSFRRYYI